MIRSFKQIKNPSTPVVFLVAWVLSEVGGLVSEKNRYETMIYQHRQTQSKIRDLISRANQGEKVSLSQIKYKTTFEQELSDIEQFDQIWSNELSQQVPSAPTHDNGEKKRRSDVKGTFV